MKKHTIFILVNIMLLIFCIKSTVFSEDKINSKGSTSPRELLSPSPNQINLKTDGPSDPKEVEAFFDGIMSTLKLDHIAGATVAVVKDDHILLAKGYGYADLEKQKPVIANQTLFRAGSITKLFTWIAVMQLYEQGELDLNADVNIYLKQFKIPATFSKPITMTNIMTHTTGFEDAVAGLMPQSFIPPLSEMLIKYMPKRVLPPGELVGYSNYAASLAGYIVEQISGMPYEKYIKEKIFKPLKMKRSSMEQPLPPHLVSDMSCGYGFADDKYIKEEFELFPCVPAGALSTTATDMANFMIANLQKGYFKNNRILKKSTAIQMQSHLFSHDPRFCNGWTYGFMETKLNNQRLVGHGGDTIYFHSFLELLPEKNIGFFVSYNSATAARSIDKIATAFMDHYYPVSKFPLLSNTTPILQNNLAKYEGIYFPVRSTLSNQNKLALLFDQIKIKVVENNILSVAGKKYIPIGPLVFRAIIDDEPNSSGLLMFQKDKNGKITQMFLDDIATDFIKQPWYANNTLNFCVLGFCVAVFLYMFFIWPTVFFVNRKNGKNFPMQILLANWIAWGICGFNLLSVVGFLMAFSHATMMFAIFPPLYSLILKITMIAQYFNLALLSPALLFLSIIAWRHKYYWNFLAKINYIFIVIAEFASILFVLYWNLIMF